MGKQEAKAKYVHFVAPVKEVPEWWKKFNFHLVESMQDMYDSFKEWKPDKSCFMAFDTETTGLNHEECELVGFSYCLNGKDTYYVPIYHFNYAKNLGEEAVEYIYARMCEAKLVFFFNARYDCRIMEYRGYKDLTEEQKKQRFLYVKYDMSKVGIYDVAVPCWLADTNIKMPSLKDSSERFLGMKMMHFQEVTEAVGNFFYTNPGTDPNVAFYAGSDALCTFLLVPATMRFFKEASFVSKLDNKILYPLMHCEHERLWLDKERLQQIMEELDTTIDEKEREVYEAFGYQINLNSPVQLAQAFERLGIDTGKRTSKGLMSTGIELLEGLSEKVKQAFPALKAFIEYKTLYKLRSSYVSVLLKVAETRGYLHCSYKTQQVPTGRFASGQDKNNNFFSPINIQSMPKPHVQMCYVFDLHDRTLFSRKKNIILGYQFIPVKKGSDGRVIEPVSTSSKTLIGLSEGMQKHLNVRDCVLPKMYEDDGEDDFIWMACLDPLTSFVETLEYKYCPLSVVGDVIARGEIVHVKTEKGYRKVLHYTPSGKKHAYKLVMKDGSEIICSKDHKFMTSDGWKTLENISTADILSVDNYTSGTISTIIDLGVSIDMVDIGVEETHSFYTNSVLTHNCDYAAQELRIPANLSREQVWTEAFATPGGDVHRSTACKIWGEENYNRDFRKLAKGANFSILYGAMAQSFADDPDYHMTLPEAEDFYNNYKNALPTLFLWEERLQRRGRRDGTVTTYFGRPRRVKGYFDNRQFAFGNRTIINTTVQGTASDILKIVLCKLWKNLFSNPAYREDCAWRTTIHDEIDYTARTTRANEIGKIIEDTQRFTLPEWPVVIDVELSMGWSMGNIYAMAWNESANSYEPKVDDLNNTSSDPAEEF